MSSEIGHQVGTTFEWTGFVTDPDIPDINGDPSVVDITDWVITFTAKPSRPNASTRKLITFVVTIIDAPNGVYTIDQPDLDINNWLINEKYTCKLIMTKPGGFIFPAPAIILDSREFL